MITCSESDRFQNVTVVDGQDFGSRGNAPGLENSMVGAGRVHKCQGEYTMADGYYVAGR